MVDLSMAMLVITRWVNWCELNLVYSFSVVATATLDASPIYVKTLRFVWESWAVIVCSLQAKGIEIVVYKKWQAFKKQNKGCITV